MTLRLGSKNPFIKLAAFIQIKKLLNKMNSDTLKETNKKLIFGIFNREEKAELLKNETPVAENDYILRKDSVEIEIKGK